MLPIVYKKRDLKPVGIFRDKTSVRRNRLLEQQSHYRKGFFEELRQKALDVILDYSTEEINIQSSSNEKKHKHRKSPKPFSGSNHLVIPDFLVDVPADLASDWFAYLRPEGQRVVLISSCGRCCVFNKNGFFVESFKSALPSNGCTILDGVLVRPPSNNSHSLSMNESMKDNLETDAESSFKHEIKSAKKLDDSHCFYICDCICWNDFVIADSSAECRYFLLKSRFEELAEVLGTVSSSNSRCLHIVDIVEARPDDLARLHYYSHTPFLSPDSIIFVHKEAIYTPGISQLYLCWRDFSLSRFAVDTLDDSGLTIPFYQQANLLLRLSDAVVLTEDRVVVARLNKESLQSQLQSLPPTIYLIMWMKGRIKNELLIRVSVVGLALEGVPDDSCVDVSECSATDLLIGMKIIGTPSPKRVRADTLNRIIHQFILRQIRIRQFDEKLKYNNNIPSLFSMTELGQEENTVVPKHFVYNGPLFDFEVILKCAATGESHSRMLLLRGERNLEEFLDVEDGNDGLEDWC